MESARAQRTQAPSQPTAAPAPQPQPSRAAPSALSVRLLSGPPAIRLNSSLSTPSPANAPHSLAQLMNSPGPGSPLPSQIQERLEDSFQTDLQPVRVHADARSAEVVDNLPARAITYGVHVFLGSRESPNDLPLMAHEVTHVVQQQGSPVLQMSTGLGTSDVYEQEAQQAASGVQRGEQVTVRGRTGGSRAQGLFGWAVSWLEDRVWGLIERYAPELAPILRQGVFEWLKDKIASAIETVFNTLMAPVRAVTGVVQSLSAHVSDLLAWMREAAAQIARGDCSAITQAAEKIHKVIDGIASPILDRVKQLAKQVRDFFTGLWDRFGAPAWEFLRRVGGAVWERIHQFGSWIWEKTAPIRNALSRAWTWIKNKLGIGEGPEGQNGILQWIQGKAAAAWDWLKAKIEPIKRPLLIIGGVLALLSPAGPFIAVGAAVGGLIVGIRWIRQHLNTPDGVVQNRGVLQGVIIPGIMNAIRGFTGTLTRIVGSITERLNRVMGGLGQAVSAVAGSFMRFAIGALQWLAEQFRGLVQWASEKLNGLVHWISSGLERLRVFLQPVLDFLGKVAEVILDLLKLPALILGRVWHAIPACIRNPFVNFLINRILIHVPLFHQIVGLVQVWSKMSAAAMTALRQVFRDGNFTGALKTVFRAVLDALGIPLELVTGIFTKAASALDLMIRDPLGFLRNALGAIKQGFVQFITKIGTYLLNSVLDWLTGELADTGITVPSPFNVGAIFNLVLQVIGLTIENIFSRLARRVGPGVVAHLRRALNMLSGAWEWVGVLIREGPGGLWRQLQQRLSDLKEQFINGVIGWVIEKISRQALAKLLSFLDVTGIMPVVNGIIAIYRAVQSFVRYLRQILQILNSFLDGLVGVAGGAIGPAANFLEGALSRAMTVALGFLANQAGLSGIGTRLQEIVGAVRERVSSAVDWLIERAMAAGRAILQRLGLGEREQAAGAAEGQVGDVREQARRELSQRLNNDQARPQVEAVLRDVLVRLQPQGLKRLELGTEDSDNEYVVSAEASPLQELLDYMFTDRETVYTRMFVRLRLRGNQPIFSSLLAVPGTSPVTTPATIPGQSQVRALTFTPVEGKSVVGGVLIPPQPGSDEVYIGTWNTADAARRHDNRTHAELQFKAWLQQQPLPWRQRVQQIEIEINYSPCKLCVETLGEILPLLPARNRLVSPGLRYHTVYKRGRIKTTKAALGILRQRGWDIIGPEPEK